MTFFRVLLWIVALSLASASTPTLANEDKKDPIGLTTSAGEALTSALDDTQKIDPKQINAMNIPAGAFGGGGGNGGGGGGTPGAKKVGMKSGGKSNLSLA